MYPVMWTPSFFIGLILVVLPWHDFYFGCHMKEEIYVSGKKIWLLIEPHIQEDGRGDQAAEYFTASYDIKDLPASPGGILFLEEDNTPKRFESPVQALEFASEKLQGLI
jgi:hypothetical protein